MNRTINIRPSVSALKVAMFMTTKLDFGFLALLARKTRSGYLANHEPRKKLDFVL